MIRWKAQGAISLDAFGNMAETSVGIPFVVNFGRLDIPMEEEREPLDGNIKLRLYKMTLQGKIACVYIVLMTILNIDVLYYHILPDILFWLYMFMLLPSALITEYGYLVPMQSGTVSPENAVPNGITIIINGYFWGFVISMIWIKLIRRKGNKTVRESRKPTI